MIGSKFGYAGQNQVYSPDPSLANINRRIEDLANKLIPARVIDVILDETHPDFVSLGEWNGIGIIKYELILSPESEKAEKNIAKPLLANTKTFPLKNEIVFLISLPDTDSLNNLTDNEVFYYLNVISLWNHPHHNAFPNPQNSSTIPEAQRKDYKSIESGNVRRVTDNSTEINLNSTNNSGGKFVERVNIHPILPFTGDNIFEGRFGNSIRLGSTIKSKSQYQNNWSTTGQEGDPITIIRNGQPLNSSDEGWLPIVEDINNDLSSIYITSTQKIPINVSSVNYTGIRNEYIPIFPQSYNLSQVILNSERLLFNSTTDSILLSSKKVISLSAIEDIGLSSRGNISLSSKGVRLGGSEANESLIMGDSFIFQFNKLLDSLSLLCEALTTEPALKSTPLIATGIRNTIEAIKKTSNTFTSKISKTL
jgi:hypothetical protein